MNNQGDFFIMLTTQSGSYTPLMNTEGDDIAKFDNEYDAAYSAANNTLGENFGFDIFEIGCGC